LEADVINAFFERANDQDRTGDLIPTKDVLYQLSYIGNSEFAVCNLQFATFQTVNCPFANCLERKTGLEPATYSLEGYRSTK
jgi:hypothetical protein